MKPYYSESGIEIYHGDCREILPQLSFDAVLSDPPYGMNLVPQRGVTEPIAGDGQVDARRLWGWMVPQVWMQLPPDATMLLFSRWSESGWVKPLLDGWFEVKSCLVWVKNRFGIGYHTRPQHEFVWYCLKGNPPKPETAISDVVEADVEFEPQHSCQKPESLMSRLLSLTTGIVVADPFCGTGSTLLAAKQLGRRAIGIEICEKYCEISAKRLSQSVFQFSPETETEPELQQSLLGPDEEKKRNL